MAREPSLVAQVALKQKPFININTGGAGSSPTHLDQDFIQRSMLPKPERGSSPSEGVRSKAEVTQGRGKAFTEQATPGCVMWRHVSMPIAIPRPNLQ